jgi:hypothetical protein
LKPNEILGNALLIYNSTQKSIISFPIKTLLKIIAPNRYKRILPGILMKIKEITDLKSLLIAKKHDMRTGTSRREYVNYKINGKASREARQIGADLTNIKFAKTINIRYL